MLNFVQADKEPVSRQLMEKIYARIRTPKKLGAVIRWEDSFTDCPTVFRKDDMFYMYFLSISKNCINSGYETHLARSRDLKNWEYVGKVLGRASERVSEKEAWNSRQCGGYAAFPDIKFGGSNLLQKVNGHYYISCMCGNRDGYEPDPLMMGMAVSEDPADPEGFRMLPEPVLRPDDPDAREGEKKTLYKSFMFEDPLRSTGHRFVNAYNGKAGDDRERIYLAVSDDGETWERYGDRAVIDLITDYPDGLICGDPQIILIDDIYVMFFFRYEKGKGAYNTFACSRDLVSWTVWTGEPLIKSEYEWENVHAHKTWFLRHDGINYHFYCAVNDQNERFIALAVSK